MDLRGFGLSDAKHVHGAGCVHSDVDSDAEYNKDNDSESSDHEIPDRTNLNAMRDAQTASDEQEFRLNQNDDSKEHQSASDSDDEETQKQPLLTYANVPCTIVQEMMTQLKLTTDVQELPSVPDDWAVIIDFFQQQAELEQRYKEDDITRRHGNGNDDDEVTIADPVEYGIMKHALQCEFCAQLIALKRH